MDRTTKARLYTAPDRTGALVWYVGKLPTTFRATCLIDVVLDFVRPFYPKTVFLALDDTTGQWERV